MLTLPPLTDENSAETVWNKPPLAEAATPLHGAQ
jgi:hypothetical protein